MEWLLIFYTQMNLDHMKFVLVYTVPYVPGASKDPIPFGMT